MDRRDIVFKPKRVTLSLPNCQPVSFDPGSREDGDGEQVLSKVSVEIDQAQQSQLHKKKELDALQGEIEKNQGEVGRVQSQIKRLKKQYLSLSNYHGQMQKEYQQFLELKKREGG